MYPKHFRNIFRLIRVVVPGPLSKEFGLLILVAVVLVLRTYADVWMISNGTAVEGSGYCMFMYVLNNRLK